jgi:hypothetical protein
MQGSQAPSASSAIIINRSLNGKKIGFSSSDCMRAVALHLLEEAQKGLKVKGARMLAADVLTEEDVIGIKQKLMVLDSIGSNQMPKNYGEPCYLPLLNMEHPLARMYMEKANKEGHERVTSMLH